MMTDEPAGRAVLDALAKHDVARSGYKPMDPTYALIEGYDPEQADVQDRLARIVFGAVMGVLQEPRIMDRGPLAVANGLARSISIVLAETGWNDNDSPNRIEVKRDAGQ